MTDPTRNTPAAAVASGLAEPGSVHASFASGFMAITDDGEWLVTADWSHDAPVEFRTLTVQPLPESGEEHRRGVTSSVLQRLPIGRWLAFSRTALAAEFTEMLKADAARGNLPANHDLTSLAAAGARALHDQKPSRRTGDTDIYRRVAEAYLDIQAREGTRGINRRVAEAVGDGSPVPEGTFRDWLRRATELGYLTPGERGRAGRMPGPALTPQEED